MVLLDLKAKTSIILFGGNEDVVYKLPIAESN
jgi:hypothetical protein